MALHKVRAMRAFPVNTPFTWVYICPECNRQTSISSMEQLGYWSTKFCAFCGLKLSILLSTKAENEQ